MQAIISVTVIDEQDAYKVGYKTLQNQLGSNMELYEDTVQYSRSNASTNQLGDVFVQVTTTGIAAPEIELSNVNNTRSEEHTSELQSLVNLVCRLLLEKKNNTTLILLPLAHINN